MTLQQLIYFKEVAVTLHFTRAADNLLVTQPSLSCAIQTLERELGVPLFLRKKCKKVVTTSYGKTFLPYVERMLAELEAGQKAVEHMVRPNSGAVNIVYTFINGHHAVQDLIGAFYAEEENADIAISPMVNHGTMSFFEQISSGAADLAISCLFPEESGVKVENIGKQKLYCVLNANHPLASRKTLSLEDIKTENIIRFSTSLSLYDWVTNMFEFSGIAPKYIDGFSDWSILIQQVANNKGVTILPYLSINPREVKAVPLEHPRSVRDVYLLWASDRELSPPVEYVRRFCLNHFSNGMKDVK